MIHVLQHPAEHLTSNYKTDADSNNYKLLSLGHEQHLEIFNNLNRMEGSRDIDIAEGFTLDKAGKNVLELRRDRDDEAFRRAIKVKIRGNLSCGTIDDVNDVCGILFGDNFQSVMETWDKPELDREPAAILISIVDDHDFFTTFLAYIKYLVMEIKAGGVRLYNKFITKIRDEVIYYAALTAESYTAMQIPMDPLGDIVFTNAIFVNQFVSHDNAFGRIPSKEMVNRELGNEIFINRFMSFDTASVIMPGKELTYREINGGSYIAGALCSTASFKHIPMAIPKGEDKIESRVNYTGTGTAWDTVHAAMSTKELTARRVCGVSFEANVLITACFITVPTAVLKGENAFE